MTNPDGPSCLLCGDDAATCRTRLGAACLFERRGQPEAAWIGLRGSAAAWSGLREGDRRDLLDALDHAIGALARRHPGVGEAVAAFEGLTPSAGPARVRLAPWSARRPALMQTHAAPPLLIALRDALDRASSASIAVAYASRGGVEALEAHMRELLGRGGRLEVMVGADVGATSPEALRLLLDMQVTHPEQVALHVVEPPPGTIFHPKAYIFNDARGPARAFLGSANLTWGGLQRNREWTLRLDRDFDPVALEELQAAFARALRGPEVRPLDEPWLDDFAERVEALGAIGAPTGGAPTLGTTAQERRAQESPTIGAATPDALGSDEERPAPAPHAIQRQALDALAQSRQRGLSAALVVLATGLGKTFLAAFDVAAWQDRAGRRARVLFVAHREEILAQAIKTFRAVHPRASIGLYKGAERDPRARILMASIQTLGRAADLSRFEEEHFDFVIVDEFHHAAAATYKRLLDHFNPAFLLGLTATPDRRDGQDLLNLCAGHIAFRCDLWEGIRQELLSPLQYRGVPDDVDYEHIRWRSGRFDEHDLDAAIAHNTHRAEHALRELQACGGRRTLAFCISQRHADFMADFFQARGLRAASVHSGPTSAPRAAALRQLDDGDLDVLCAVDMFNEGVDVPRVDAVLMLRPTESPIVWLQQMGRGLRRAQGKTHLAVLDFIGNHRMFSNRPLLLLEHLDDGQRSLAALLVRLHAGDLDLPEGCAVDFDLVVLDHLTAALSKADLAALQRRLRALQMPDVDTEGPAELWATYTRPQIAETFGIDYINNVWSQGVLNFAAQSALFLLVTLIKDDLADDHQYVDRFLDRETMSWQSQRRTTQASAQGRRFRAPADEGITIHLFVRRSKTEGGRSTPFTYCGPVDFIDWQGERPITIRWRLRHALPDPLLEHFTRLSRGRRSPTT